MRVYKCDRCGRYVSLSAKDFFVRNPTRGVYKFGVKKHLCATCEESFRKWLNECGGRYTISNKNKN